MKFTLSLLVLSILVIFGEATHKSSQNLLNKLESSIYKKQKQDENDLKKFKNMLNMVEGFFHHVSTAEPSFKEQSSKFTFKETKPEEAFPLKTGVFGPGGVPCGSSADCNEKNKAYYSDVKLRLTGIKGASGEQGPQGAKGKQGPEGNQGPKGKDGVSPSKEYLQQLFKIITQKELLNSAMDSIVNITTINPEIIFEEIYYTSVNNCKIPRTNYIRDCNADKGEICESGKGCCPTVECEKSLDNLYCCFKEKKATLEAINRWDLTGGSSWFDVLTEVKKRQFTAMKNQVPNAPKSTLLNRFEKRMETCKSESYNFTNKCYVIAAQTIAF